MSRGVRHGRPISAISYLFIADILALKKKKKNNDQILGNKPSNHSKEFKRIQHADDLTLFLRNREYLKEVLKTIKVFSKPAGCKPNIDTTECVLTGHLKICKNDIFGIKINRTSIKCLGLYIRHNKDKCYQKNWIDKCEVL